MNRIFASALLASAALFAAPLAAQDQPGDRVNMVVIFGDDACPESTADEITVCARKAESERFRIPEKLRESEDGENVAWARRVEKFETVGAFGTLSCSPAGAGGITGCTQAMIDAAYGEKSEDAGIRFGQLIEQARAERLATIDEDAADEQARVEAIEREYMERLEREREAEVPDNPDSPDAEPLPDPNGPN